MSDAPDPPFRLFEPWVGQLPSGHVVVQFCLFPGRAEQQKVLDFDGPGEAREWLAQALARVQELAPDTAALASAEQTIEDRP